MKFELDEGANAQELVQEYMKNEGPTTLTQEIINSGIIPKLKDHMIRPGKVSDCISGGRSKFEMKEDKWEAYKPLLKDRDFSETPFQTEEDGKPVNKVRVEFENPELTKKDGTPLIIMVRTDRISTHDILRGSIPFKDQILAMNHNYMRKLLAPAIGTSQYEVPGLGDNAVVIVAENLQQLAFENVLRAYMAKSTTDTSLYQHYIKGAREFCGHKLPEGLVANGILPYVMDTPSTKSDEHDKSVSPLWLTASGICKRGQYDRVRNGSIFAFGVISEFLRNKGLIAVDTKTEHGVNSKGQIVSQDEIWTMDSSRFWLTEDYNKQLELLIAGREDELVKYLQETQPGIKEKDYMVDGKVILSPKSYSKEFARGFSKGDQGYTDEQRAQIAIRYIEGVQHLLGQPFNPDMRSREERVIGGLETVVKEIIN